MNRNGKRESEGRAEDAPPRKPIYAAMAHAGAKAYRRKRDLPGLVPLWPYELADESVEGIRRILTKLAKALRAERRRARSAHWSYDLNRHLALLSAYQAEQMRLEASLPRPRRKPPAAGIDTATAMRPGLSENRPDRLRPARTRRNRSRE